MNSDRNPVVQVAHEQMEEKASGIRTLSTGVRVRLKVVSASLITEVQARVKDPSVPTVWDAEREREIENPTHPAYLKGMKDAEDARSMAAADAFVMFGVELIDPMPKDKTWIKRLKLLGISVDEKDDLAVEYAYKKYIAIGTADLPTIMSFSAIGEQEVLQAFRNFPGLEEGLPDRTAESEGSS